MTTIVQFTVVCNLIRFQSEYIPQLGEKRKSREGWGAESKPRLSDKPCRGEFSSDSMSRPYMSTFC